MCIPIDVVFIFCAKAFVCPAVCLPAFLQPRTSMVAFVTGLYLDQETEGGQVHISYGAADIESRLMTVKVSHVGLCMRCHELPSRRSILSKATCVLEFKRDYVCGLGVLCISCAYEYAQQPCF